MNKEEEIAKLQSSVPKTYPRYAGSPSNCRTPCCYGKGRPFCFPCMKKILGRDMKPAQESEG